MKHLAPINDQVPQSPPGGQKFPDDNAHQSQADIDFHGAEDGGHTGREYDFKERILLTAAQGGDQLQLFRIHLEKAGIKADDGAEDGDGNAGDDDGIDPGAQPYDQKRGQGGFGQAV